MRRRIRERGGVLQRRRELGRSEREGRERERADVGIVGGERRG